MSITEGMAMKYVANISLNGQWWMSAIVSTDYTGEEVAKAKCLILEQALKSFKLVDMGHVKVTLQRWEGSGRDVDFHK